MEPPSMTIRLLPAHLVNKIAAGEIIERPASIVKELIENSLDARATRIDIAVTDGGKAHIRVTDDGEGMDQGDLALTFTPHATSKLANEEDLLKISTMGFRGEALASVVAVSHAHIRTCSRNATGDSGFEIEASGDTVGAVRPCAAAAGTTVTVRDLFFNTPARRKFLRTANTESAHVAEQVARLALPHPHVTFTLTHNDRQVYNLLACESTRRRVCDLFGAELGDVLLPVAQRGRQEVTIAGLIGPPSAARSSGKWQYFFLNGRHIRDRLLGHALREAYRGLIDHNRWPVAFIFVEVDPTDVDVNVHPTKIEVRFRNSQQVHAELLAALRETLNKANLAPTAALADAVTPDEPAAEGADDKARKDSLRQAMADFFKSAPPPQPRLSFPQSTRPVAPVPNGHTQPRESGFSIPFPPAQPQDPAQPPAAEPTWRGEVRTHDHPAPQGPPSTPPPATSPPATVLQVHDSYIVARCDDGLIIIDQHALHERVIYNELRSRLADPDTSGLEAQRLLIPATLRVSAAEADLLAANARLLGCLGIEVVPFGPDTLAVQQFPTLLIQREVETTDFLREVLDKLREDQTTDGERALEGILQTMACKAAIKAGQPLTQAEMESLLARREQADKASSCPHGRPTTLKLTLKDLQRQFKRG
jgi:DNA mismatch repair protein MutL